VLYVFSVVTPVLQAEPLYPDVSDAAHHSLIHPLPAIRDSSRVDKA